MMLSFQSSINKINEQIENHTVNEMKKYFHFLEKCLPAQQINHGYFDLSQFCYVTKYRCKNSKTFKLKTNKKRVF